MQPGRTRTCRQRRGCSVVDLHLFICVLFKAQGSAYTPLYSTLRRNVLAPWVSALPALPSLTCVCALCSVVCILRLLGRT